MRTDSKVGQAFRLSGTHLINGGTGLAPSPKRYGASATVACPNPPAQAGTPVPPEIYETTSSRTGVPPVHSIKSPNGRDAHATFYRLVRQTLALPLTPAGGPANWRASLFALRLSPFAFRRSPHASRRTRQLAGFPLRSSPPCPPTCPTKLSKRSRKPWRRWIALLPLLIALGCASPRVVEVSSRTRLQDIDAADQYLFVRDQASRATYQPQDLPADAQRQEFFVRWTSATAGLVKFEYRQVDKPNTVREQTYTPHGDQAKVFGVRGEEFRAGGPVSAWRVTLWNGDQLLAEKRSALW